MATHSSSSLDCSFLASCFSRSFTSASCFAFMSFSVTRPGAGHTGQNVCMALPASLAAPLYCAMLLPSRSPRAVYEVYSTKYEE
ncbi:hypothetical protein EYF80_052260 [Liparis tanakae]|uniref:Uncharacterized protein n=1 Tax=Liparis tanakae TaxID=230148 RepID=A0A4Z2F9R6_9TELE|nr:hypothetical protein EYF80_052260 [Liparis tanakae]